MSIKLRVMNRFLPDKLTDDRLQKNNAPLLKSNRTATNLLIVLSLPVMIVFHACASPANEIAAVCTSIAATPGIQADAYIVIPGEVKQLIEITSTVAAN